MAVPDELSEWIAKIFAALGHPLRVRIIMLLDDGDRSVAGLTEILGVSQQVVSFHIRCLKKAGLVVPVERDWPHATYELERAQFRSALDLIVALGHERPPRPLADLVPLAADPPSRPIP
jgi:DNA-binding transcriptional ArsR family regulator